MGVGRKRSTHAVEDSSFRSQLQKQRSESRFCDILLHVGSRCFPAHRNVLAAASLFFQSVLKGHSTAVEEIRINQQEASLVERVLDFIYSGSIVVDDSNVRQFLDMADFFLITSLKELCEQYLTTCISLDSCLVTRETAATYNLTRLSTAVHRFIRSNVSQVLEQPLFLKMSSGFVEGFLTDPRTGCFALPAMDLLHAVVMWVKRDIPVRSCDFGILLDAIQLNRSDQVALSIHLESESLYQESKLCFYAIVKYLSQKEINVERSASELEYLRCDVGGIEDIEDGEVPRIQENKSSHLTGQMEQMSVEFLSRGQSDCSASDDGSENGYGANGLKSNLMMREELEKLEVKEATETEATETSGRGLIFDEESEDSLSAAEGEDCSSTASIQCPHCTFSAKSATLAEQHLANIHEEDQTYRCKICSYECKWNSDFFKHMKEHFPGPPFRCLDCPFQDSDVRNLLFHRMCHAGDVILTCSLCDYGTKVRSDLAMHVQLHAGDKRHRCSHCGRCFGLEQSLNRHLLTHLPHETPLPQTSRLSPNIGSRSVSHKRVTPPEGLFRCQQANCSYYSTRRSQLAAHTRSHLSIRCHICSICARGFVEKSHLIRHERIHLQEKPFKCDCCDYSSTRRDKLKEHVQKHHPLLTNARTSRRRSRQASDFHPGPI